MEVLPLVSCIMPTRNRRMFVGQAIAYFLRQDYSQKELIIVDDGEDEISDLVPNDSQIRYVRLNKRLQLGAKRNLACEQSQGELIAHWDDDDWMASDRISCQVNQMLASGREVSGASELLHYRLWEGEAWRYRHPMHPRNWVAGGTLLYRRSIWEQHPFPEINVGEDTAFVYQCSPDQFLVLPQSTSYVAILHGANTAAKNFMDARWQPYGLNEIVSLLGEDISFYIMLRQNQSTSSLKIEFQQNQPTFSVPSRVQVLPPLSKALPLVTCIMPTYNRRQFIPQAIVYFQRQTYPNRELLIVDDGSESVADLIPSDSAIHYLCSSKRLSIGKKRNLACEVAQGELLMFWDDDDWYGGERIAYQVSPLLSGEADITALGNSPMLCLSDLQFWNCTSQVHDRMFVRGVHGGTLAFRKSIWQRGNRFPDSSLAEDAAFLETEVSQGARLVNLANFGVFFYVRHKTNSWQFQVGEFIGRDGWQRVDPPTFVPAADLVFYGVESVTSQTNFKEVTHSQSPSISSAVT